MFIININICIKFFIFIAGAISKDSPLKETENNILRKRIFTIDSNSYMIKKIHITE